MKTYVDHPTACIDHVPNSPYGGIDLPPDEFYQVHTLPLGLHLLQGLAIPPDLLLGHNLKYSGPPDTILLVTCLFSLRSINSTM